MLLNNGKTFCYINNFDDETQTSSTGGVDRGRVYLRGGLNRDSNNNNNNSYWCGNKSGSQSYEDSILFIKRQVCHSLLIYLSKSSLPPQPTNHNTDSSDCIDDLSVIFKGSYNNEHDDVSYINPIIMHATLTVKNNTNNNITVNTVELYGRTAGWDGANFVKTSTNGFGFETRWVKLVQELLDTPVTLAPGDTATFTITVK